MQIDEWLSSEINDRLKALSYRFEDGPQRQLLCVEPYEPVYFDPNAGGAVQGGSGQWMRNKHRSGGIHEPGTVAALQTIRDTAVGIKTFMDIGALYGYFSLLFAAFFEEANAFAFEMNPLSFSAMARNFRQNMQLCGHRLQPVRCALSDKTERGKRALVFGFELTDYDELGKVERLLHSVRQLARFATNDVLNALRRGGSQIRHGDWLENMDYWSVDDWCATEGVSPDLMKIDVEGFQAKIVPGALRTLERCKPIVLLEFDSSSSVNAFGTSNKEVIRPLFDLGYKLVWGDHRSRAGAFKPLKFEELNASHERNSLAVLFVEERLRLV